MDRQKETKVDIPEDPAQARSDLDAAKGRLTGQAQKISLKAQMVKHPYITIGAVFLSGLLLGGSNEARGDIARKVLDVIGKTIENEVTKNDGKD